MNDSQEAGLGSIIDIPLGGDIPSDSNSVEAKIKTWTKEVEGFQTFQPVIAKLFIDQAEKLHTRQVKHTSMLRNVYQRSYEVMPTKDFDNWKPWFQHINDLCQDYATHGGVSDVQDWVPFFRGIGEELRSVK